MNRRDFIRGMLIASGMAYDIDKLLWLPGEKTLFLPPAKVFVMPHIDWTPYGRTVTTELEFITALKREFGITA